MFPVNLQVDLEQTQRLVEKEEGLSLAHKFNCSFYETSAAHRSLLPAKEACLKYGCPKTGCLKTGCLKTGCLKTGCLKTGFLKTGCLKTGFFKTGCLKVSYPETGCLRIRCLKTV